MRMLILSLILVSLMFYGCLGFGAPEQNLSNNTTVAPPPPPPKPPSFMVTNPTSGQLITISENASDIILTLTTQNLLLKSPGGVAKKGEGYFKVTVDDLSPVTLTSKTYTISGLGVGDHRVKVELYNNDKTPYSPPISKEISFTIEKEKPKEYVPQNHTVTIVGSTYSPNSLTVKIGDHVTWVNNGNVPQSATCFIGGKQMFDTKTLGSGQSATITFTDLLECDYYSVLFRAMKGHISVVSNETG